MVFIVDTKVIYNLKNFSEQVNKEILKEIHIKRIDNVYIYKNHSIKENDIDLNVII